jgi:hypothetical protein
MLALALVAGACADRPTPSGPAIAPALSEVESSNLMRRYVAIGTSISMGVQSDGVKAQTQQQSWPAQLAQRAGVPFDLPLISGVGCKSPIAAPLALGRRESGEPVTTPDSLLRCDPLEPGVELPTSNVAISGATTLDVLSTTPETARGVLGKKLYSLVLPPNTTQLEAALYRKPLVVSVELGANEVLGARSGIAIVAPNGSIVPPAIWSPNYDAVLDAVTKNTPRVVVSGLIRDAANFPGFRYGHEIAADATALLGAFHVAVSSDCNGSQNLIFVPVRIPTAVATGLAYRNAGLPPFSFACADQGPTTQDFVLTPAELAIVNQTLATMTAHIRANADRRRLAYFELEALYGLPNLKPPFSSIGVMTSPQPYGPYISLDGIHPNGAGQAILANAAARALNERYRLRIPDATSFIASR